jgi:predicted Rossmann fold flavoprotein
VARVERRGIAWHEKHKGQLFCDGPSTQIVAMLLDDCRAAGVRVEAGTPVAEVDRDERGFRLRTALGTLRARQLVVATGGLSIPAVGATDFGQRLAARFGHRVVPPRPALVPLVLDRAAEPALEGLAGVALPVRVATADGRTAFEEDLLLTHRGLSGPAALQISTWWRPGERLAVDLAPGTDLRAALREAKASGRRAPRRVLADHLPDRLAVRWLEARGEAGERPLAERKDADIDALAASLQAWRPLPTGTEGWKKAEVTAGGVDTDGLDPRRLESRHVPGLHFIGEVVDVTGWLGGYNFQWAWASAAACAESLRPGA